MVDTNTKIAGNSRVLRGTFYTGGEFAKAILTTNIGVSNGNVILEAKAAGILGNDISLSYIDTGLENSDFKLDVKNGQDIEVTLERTNSRASFTTTNASPDANVKFTAVTAGAAGNDITISHEVNSTTPIVISACAISSKIVTITTASAHGFVIGDVVGISGLVSDNEVNGCFQIATVADTTHFTYALSASTTITSATGFGIASKLDIAVATKAITIKAPQDTAGAPMTTPKALILAWGRFASAKALAICELVGESGNKPIGYISTRNLTKGKTSAVSTTSLDVKRAIEADATAKLLVDVFIPIGENGSGALVAMPKSFLTGGSNLIKIDPDGGIVNVFVYNEWEDVIATSDTTYIAEHPDEDVDLIDNMVRKALGAYECIYAPNQKYRVIHVEFKGTINDENVLSRQRVDLDWAFSDIPIV